MSLRYRASQSGKAFVNCYRYFAWRADSFHRQFLDHRLCQLYICAVLGHRISLA